MMMFCKDCSYFRYNEKLKKLGMNVGVCCHSKNCLCSLLNDSFGCVNFIGKNMRPHQYDITNKAFELYIADNPCDKSKEEYLDMAEDIIRKGNK